MPDFITVDMLKEMLLQGAIIYGAGGVGNRAYNYLETIGLSDRILFFVDGDSKKQGAKLHERTIYPPTKVAEYPLAVVILATTIFNELRSILDDLGVDNPVLCYFHFTPEYPDEEFILDKARLLSSLASDDKISHLIACLMYENRTNPVVSRIQPYEEVSQLYLEYPINMNREAYTILDVGAFDGDSYLYFSKTLGGKIRKYHAFEPDPRMADLWAEKFAGEISSRFMEFHPTGLSNATACVPFFVNENLPVTNNFIAGPMELSARLTRFDEMNIEIVGKAYVKMDIEGFELDALQGMENFIRQNKPDLCICMYHKANDFYHIPEYIKSIVPDYQIEFRGGAHAVCCATVNE